MSDDTEVEQLLDNFQKALDTLNDIGNVEVLINRLDASKNRKLLKRVKHVVGEVHNVVGNIKEKVSKAYKRVKIRSSSESEELALNDGIDKDVSDKDDDVDQEVEDISANNADEGKVSPIIGQKGRNVGKSLGSKSLNNRKDNSSESLENVSNVDGEKNDEVSIANKDNSLDKDGNEMDVDKAKDTETSDSGSKEKQDTSCQIEPDKSKESNDAEEKESESSQDVIEGTPEKPSKKGSVSMRKNLTVILDKSDESTNVKGDNDKDREKNEKDEEKNKSTKKTSIKDKSRSKQNESEELDDPLIKKPTKDTGETTDTKQQDQDKQSTVSQEGEGTEELDEQTADDGDEISENPEENKEKENLGNSEKDDNEKDSDGKVADDKVPLATLSIPKIKLVDISKLLAPNTKPLEVMTPSPKAKKSVTFDSSVIILSSSDEETPKKNPKNKGKSPLKSAMRKCSVSMENSDSDTKENNENRENRRVTKRNRSESKKLTSDNSSEDSDFENSRKGRRLRSRDDRKKERFSELRVKINERKARAANKKQKYNEDSLSEKEDLHERKKKKRDVILKLSSESEDDDSEKKRGSRRNNKHQRRKEVLEISDDSEQSDNTVSSSRKKSKSKLRSEDSGTSASEDDSENEKNSRKNNKRQRKKGIKEIIEVSEQSDNSDISDSEAISSSKKKSAQKTKSKVKNSKHSVEPDINDPKFKAKVYISLPSFKCEELQEIYKRKKEIFEVKKLTDMDSIRRTRTARNGSSKNSDDSDKPDKKRIKLTLKLNKKRRAKEVSSDEEGSSTEEVKDAEGDKNDGGKENGAVDLLDDVDNAVHVGDSLAEACLDQIKDTADKGTAKDNHSDKEEEKSKEKNKNKSKKRTDSDDETERKTDEKNKTKESKLNGVLSESEKTKDDTNENDEKDKTDEESDEDIGNKKKRKKDKVLLEKNYSSDSDDEDFTKFFKKKDNTNSQLVRKTKKRMLRSVVISDSESDEDKNKKKSEEKEDSDNDDDKAEDKSSASGSNSEKEEDTEEDESSKPRKRIKRVKDSSSDDDDKATRKQLRKMIDRDSLSATTKKAEQSEKERKARIAEKQKKYNQIFELKADAVVDKVVLDFDEKTNKPLLSVHKKLVKHLKPHQVQGVKFMWDACFESLERLKKDKGSGCILAHCMGLGKTLQVITLVHTLLTNSDKTKVEKVMVVCPVNTVINWRSEFKKWAPKGDEFEIYDLVSCKTSSINHERNYKVKEWHENGGVLIIGYNMFRTLSNPDNKSLPKKLRTSFHEGMVDPGPDLVVCDEGHLLKNEKTNLSIAMNRIRTLRRIVLTGTPLQNNLREYWCMVQFIKPNLLGTYKEYLNRFVNPITNGQYTDSTQHDIIIMRRRSHVLHKLLDGVVQRQDYSVLEPYLPPKYEYVIFIKLSEVQIKLYNHYINNFARKGDGTNRTSFLFNDFQQFQRISTHPRVLLDKSIEDRDKKDMNDDSEESEGSLKDFIDDNESDAESTPDTETSASGSMSDCSIKSDEKKKKKKGKKKKSPNFRRTRVTRAQAAQKRDNNSESEVEEVSQGPKHWWQEYIDNEELDNINHSAKLFLLFQILKECEVIGDKILVFSQSLYTLNCIEYFLQRIDEATQSGETEKVGGHSGSWAIGLDYFRLDGSSSCDNRASWCDQFNDPDNIRARLFLISTKAGGLGINLVAANRVIIFDVSWNPSHDIQSIYRVYRFGQTKPSYIYRFVTYGAMEMKIYERQVTKQAISKRVIDEQQIDRHYSQNDIQELYKTDLDPQDRPIPLVPKDVLLGEMLQKYDKTIFKYHEHQSLLENKHDEQLNEEERKAAWDEFENEKVLRKTTVTNIGGQGFSAFMNTNFSPQLIQVALANIVRKDNPAWSEVQIRGILPALVTQLQMQMSEGDFSMYARVQQEVRLMQAIQAQRERANLYQQYQLQQMLQKQQLTNQMLGNLNVSPEEIRQMQLAAASQNLIQAVQRNQGPQRNTAGGSGDVIELND